MYPSVSHLHKFIASKVINKPTESSVPTAVLHITTTDLSPCILPISSPIDAKHCRNVHQHHCYQSNACAQDFVQLIDLSEPNIIVAPWTDNLVIPQPCTAVFVTLVHSKHEYEHAPVLPESMHHVPDVFHDTDKVFDRSSVPLVSHAPCNTLHFIPLFPAHPPSYTSREYTARTVSLSPTASYSAHANASKSGKDLGVCLTPSMQATDFNPC